MPEFYLDQHYRIIANGGGLDPEMAAHVAAHPELRAEVTAVREQLLRYLDSVRAYRLSHEVVAVALATAERLDGPIDLTPPVPNCWLEFERDRIGDQHMLVRAISWSKAGIQLIQSPAETKSLILEDGTWYYAQGECATPCGRPAAWTQPALGMHELTIPVVRQIPHQCACTQAADAWVRICQAFLMTLRAEGIERETITRHVGHATRRERMNMAHVPSIIHLRLSQHVVYASDPEDHDPSPALDVPTHAVQVSEYLRHLDPLRNPRWKEDKIVLVRGHERVIRGLPARYLVDL